MVVELEDKVSTDEQADGEYVVDEKHKTCTLTASGIKKAEAYFHICLLYTSLHHHPRRGRQAAQGHLPGARHRCV